MKLLHEEPSSSSSSSSMASTTTTNLLFRSIVSIVSTTVGGDNDELTNYFKNNNNGWAQQSFLLNTSTSIQQAQSQNATSFSFDLYSQLVAGLDGPFIAVFLLLFFVALTSYIFQFKHLKRNQHVMYGMMFALSLFSAFQNLTRLASELSFLHPVYGVAFDLNNVIKGIDRSMSAVLLYNQILILGFIGYVFLKTTRATSDISERVFKISKYILIALLIFIFILFLLSHVLIIAILHGLRGAQTAPMAQRDLGYVIFTTPMIVMIFGMVSTAIYLNTFGFRLYVSLRDKKRKIKDMMRNTMALDTPQESSTTPFGSLKPVNDNNNSTSSVAFSSDIGATTELADISTDQRQQHQQSSMPNSPPTSPSTTHTTSHAQLKKTTMHDSSFDHTYKLKKTALRKTLGLQMGLSICFLIQLIGLAFLPGALGWQFSLLFYHMFSNFAVLGFLIILLVIVNPLKEVQRLFKVPSNLDEKMLKKKFKLKEEQQSSKNNNTSSILSEQHLADV